MSSPTPRERQRSAARFREIADDELIERSLIKSLKEGACVPQTWTWREAFRALADLIDPTCIDTGSPEGVFTCSACGSTQYDLSAPAYCPDCGARIIEEDDPS